MCCSFPEMEIMRIFFLPSDEMVVSGLRFVPIINKDWKRISISVTFLGFVWDGLAGRINPVNEFTVICFWHLWSIFLELARVENISHNLNLSVIMFSLRFLFSSISLLLPGQRWCWQCPIAHNMVHILLGNYLYHNPHRCRHAHASRYIHLDCRN